MNRSEVSIWEEVCLIPQGHPRHVLTVHCEEKLQASASCCLRKQDWTGQEVSKVSLAERLNQLSLFTGLREQPNLISQEQNKKEKEKNNS